MDLEVKQDITIKINKYFCIYSKGINKVPRACTAKASRIVVLTSLNPMGRLADQLGEEQGVLIQTT